MQILVIFAITMNGYDKGHLIWNYLNRKPEEM